MEFLMEHLFKDLTASQLAMFALAAYAIYSLRRQITFIDGLGSRMDKMLRILTVLATEHRKNHPGSAFEDVVDVMDVGPEKH